MLFGQSEPPAGSSRAPSGGTGIGCGANLIINSTGYLKKETLERNVALG
jgi:hypothetical protein